MTEEKLLEQDPCMCRLFAFSRLRTSHTHPHSSTFIDSIQARTFRPVSRPLLGNAAAIDVDGSDLSVKERQTFFRWTNLSGHRKQQGEATEVLASGDPTVVIQKCDIGLVHVKIEADRRFALATPDFIKFEPAKEQEMIQLCEASGIQQRDVLLAQWIENRPGRVTMILSSAEAILKVQLEELQMLVEIIERHAPGAQLLVKKELINAEQAEEISDEANTRD